MPGICNASTSPTPPPAGRRHRPLTNLMTLAALAVACAGTGVVQADILHTPDGGFGVVERAGLPSRGQSQVAVLRQHGEPKQRHATVGDPPITRWDYDDFSVVFEGDYVLHSVVREAARSRDP